MYPIWSSLKKLEANELRIFATLVKSKSGPPTCVLGQRVECCTSWVKRWSAAMDFFQTFFKKTNPLLCKSLICVIKNVCFEKFLKEIHSCAPLFNPRLATFNALPNDARQGTSLRFCRIRLPLLQFYSNSVPNNSLDFLWRLGPQLIVCITC